MITTLENPKKSSQVAVADDPRWARIVARDRAADGQFWYSVMTTGVYCRPSCPSRSANPQNVQLHDTLEAQTAAPAQHGAEMCASGAFVLAASLAGRCGAVRPGDGGLPGERPPSPDA